jgi:hypothetical protein
LLVSSLAGSGDSLLIGAIAGTLAAESGALCSCVASRFASAVESVGLSSERLVRWGIFATGSGDVI